MINSIFEVCSDVLKDWICVLLHRIFYIRDNFYKFTLSFLLWLIIFSWVIVVIIVANLRPIYFLLKFTINFFDVILDWLSCFFVFFAMMICLRQLFFKKKMPITVAMSRDSIANVISMSSLFSFGQFGVFIFNYKGISRISFFCHLPILS